MLTVLRGSLDSPTVTDSLVDCFAPLPPFPGQWIFQLLIQCISAWNILTEWNSIQDLHHLHKHMHIHSTSKISPWIRKYSLEDKELGKTKHFNIIPRGFWPRVLLPIFSKCVLWTWKADVYCYNVYIIWYIYVWKEHVKWTLKISVSWDFTYSSIQCLPQQ